MAPDAKERRAALGLNRREWRYAIEAHKNEGRIRGYLRKRLRNDTLVEDSLQIIYVKLLEIGRQAQHPEIKNVLAFSLAIAQNLVIDQLRIPANPSLDDVPEPSDDSVASIEQTVESAELWAHINKAVARLPGRHRTAIVLRLKGWTYKEIATQLDITVGAVGVLLIRAIRMLTASLGTQRVRKKPKARMPSPPITDGSHQ